MSHNGYLYEEIATAKCRLPFVEAFSLGILCNWLVCLAVWMAAGAKDITGKIFAIFFPIWLFITSGFEHSVANIYYCASEKKRNDRCFVRSVAQFKTSRIHEVNESGVV